ncbi:MAG: hypothetical protein EOP45_00760 [Sphingobacteriaceae bacterium]|nr:MAG: hypothetical protein EOP45_00760 [Sphingobacteriaceae bacterium]
MNFEDLQKSWLAQPVNAVTNIKQLESNLESKWQKYQRKVLITNLFISVSFVLTLFVIGWIYLKYHLQYGVPFTVSIGLVYVLLLVFLMVSWRSYAFKKDKMEVSGVEYLSYQLQKLHWRRKTITSYIWVYTILLWLALMMYTFEVTRVSAPVFRYGAIVLITAYAFGITIWSRFVKQKKQLMQLEELTAELEELRMKLSS